MVFWLALMPVYSMQAAVPEASMAVSASLQAELLDVKQSPILCSDAVLRIVHENTQVNRSTSSESSEDASGICIHSWSIGSELVLAASSVSRSFLTAPLFLNHCNWRL